MQRHRSLLTIFFLVSILSFIQCGRSDNSVPSVSQSDISNSTDNGSGDTSTSDNEDSWWNNTGTEESNIRPECASSGNWVSVLDHGPISGDEEPPNSNSPPNVTNLNDCIVTREFDRAVRIRLFYCAHWRDMLSISGSTLSFTTYTNVQSGYIGAFAGLHIGVTATACKEFEDGKYDAKAHVEVIRENGETRTFVWHQPAFAPLRLGLPNLDPQSPTEVNDFMQLQGRADIAYTNVNNNLAPGHITHLVDIYDRLWGPNIYGFEFSFKYDVIEEGFFDPQ